MREWLKDARLQQRLTQKQMADAIGVTESYYCMIEGGDRQKKMDVSLAIKIGNVLGMSLDEIVNAEGVNEGP